MLNVSYMLYSTIHDCNFIAFLVLMISNYIRGGQIFLHKIRMFMQVWKKTLNYSIILGLCISILYNQHIIRKLHFRANLIYFKCYISHKLKTEFLNTSNENISEKEVLRNSFYISKVKETKRFLDIFIIQNFYISAIIFSLIILFWYKFGKFSSKKNILKGHFES